MTAAGHAVVVSACLLGIPCRYDGGDRTDGQLMRRLADTGTVPVPLCPEQLAGFATPRPPMFFAAGDGDEVLAGRGRVVTAAGVDLTAALVAGAEAALAIARLAGARLAVFMDRSPSCGSTAVYRGGGLVAGTGVTKALFYRAGIRVVTARDFISAAAIAGEDSR
ncbi:MAG: DUF523 domain-containing protein [Deltaproteobacteria bacterium]|nr:DUF523 domain-containing protein [Candidatus Anaeroferrophillacea bacterium]